MAIHSWISRTICAIIICLLSVNAPLILSAADLKISQLPAASEMTGAELIPCVQSGTTKKCTAAEIVNSLQVTTVNAGNSPYTVLTTDQLLLCDTTGAARTINLLAATNKLSLAVKNLGTNTCTVNRAGADLIDGATSAVLRTQYEAISLATDASTNWNVY